MIEDVLNQIRDAEEEAERLQREAYQKGKEIVLAAETRAEQQKRATVEELRADAKAAISDAEKKAAKKREVILEEGRKAAEELIAAKNGEIEAMADKVLGMLLEMY